MEPEKRVVKKRHVVAGIREEERRRAALDSSTVRVRRHTQNALRIRQIEKQESRKSDAREDGVSADICQP